jgi:iron donor protein CyaY
MSVFAPGARVEAHALHPRRMLDTTERRVHDGLPGIGDRFRWTWFRWSIMPSMSAPLTEQAFRMKVDEAIEALQQSLFDWADAEGFEVETQGGVLNILFEEPTEARFVVSPNAPVRQIWISALVKSYKLSWSDDVGAFALDGESLNALITRLIRQHLGR